MGDFEFFRLNLFFVKEEDVEVDEPWPPPKSLDPSQPPLHPFEHPQEIRGLQIRPYFDHSVYKPVLGRVADGLGLIQGGLS